MTPFDRASLSLSGAELPLPTVGGSPLISGGHVASSSGDGFPVACASAAFAAATLMNVAMTRMVGRKGNSSRTCGACYSTCGRVKCSRDVAAEGAQFMKSQLGLVMNIVLGIIGAAVASWLFSLLGITFAGWIGYLIAGFIGACILIAIARAFSGGLQQRT
jgi:uncharacterized membrane protein YeaQ/YmgE (transglycosylase-associated protein family)